MIGTKTLKATLYNTEGNADKVYVIWIEQVKGGYVVNAQWGRRGGSMQSGTKTKDPVSVEKADAIMEKVLKDKQAKGYHAGEDAPAYSMVKDSVDTGIRPMLLTAGTEDDIDRFVNDNSWGGQDKKNGKHLIVKSLNGVVTGINKRGLECPMPEAVQKALKSQNVLLDGEVIGDVLHVFDLMALGPNLGEDHRDYGLDHRCVMGLMVVKDANSPHVKFVGLVTGKKAKRALVARLYKGRKEGVVFKRLDAPYRPGRIHSLKKADNVKIKFWKEIAAKVLEWTSKQSVRLEVRSVRGVQSIGKVTVATKYVKQIKVGSIVRVKYLYATDAHQLFQAHLDPTDDGSVIADQVIPDTSFDLKYEGKDA